MSKKKSDLPVTRSFPAWDILLALAGSLVVFLVPFFPDEKLIRIKMEFLELSGVILAGMVGFRILFTGRVPYQTEKTDQEGNGFWRRPVYAMTCGVVLWVVVQMILGFTSPEKSLATNEIRRILLAAGTFCAFSWAGYQTRWIKAIFGAWAASAGLLALYGCLQVSGGIGVIQVPQMGRIIGTYGNPIFFAAFLSASLFITLGLFFSTKKSLTRFLLLLSAVVQVIALYYTQTRGAWLGVFAAFVLGGFLRYWFSGERKSFPVWPVLLFVFVTGFLAYKTKDVWSRDQGHLLIWRDTARMWADHPVTGVGLGAFHTVFPSYAKDDLKSKWPKGQFIVNYAHNEFLQTLAEGGLVGLASFLLILIIFFRFVVGYWRAPPTGAPDSLVIFTSLGIVAQLVQNLFSVDMRFGVSFATTFLMMGIVISRITEPNPDWKPIAGGTISLSVRAATAGLWILLVGFLVIPAVLKPYKAQKAVSATPGFFDQRLLDPAKSIGDLEKLAGEYPDEPDVLEKMAFVYAKEMKTADNRINVTMAQSAIHTYEAMLKLDPYRAGAYNNLANIYYTMGQSDKAIELWRKCVALQPGFTDAHLNLGKTLYVRGDLKESAQHFETVLTLDPGNPEAIVYLKRMVE